MIPTLAICAASSLAGLGSAAWAGLPQQSQQPAASTAAKPIGTIKTIVGNAITLTSDAGPVFDVVTVQN